MINPYVMRLGYNQTYNTDFFAENKKQTTALVKIDKQIRDYLYDTIDDIAQLKTEYLGNTIFVYLFVTDVNVVLGENNNKIDEIIKDLNQKISTRNAILKLNLIEVKELYSNAQAIANLIKSQLKKRMRFRLVLRNVLPKIITKREVQGLKISVKGLVDEVDMKQRKSHTWGKMSTSTLDNNIQIGKATVITSRGTIGVQVLLNLGRKKW